MNRASTAPLTIETLEGYEDRRFLYDLQIYILLGIVLGVTLLTVSLIGVLHRKMATYYAGHTICATMHLCYLLKLFSFSPLLVDIIYPLLHIWWACFALSFYLMFQRTFLAQSPRVPKILLRALFLGAIGTVAITAGLELSVVPFIAAVFWSVFSIVLLATSGIASVAYKIVGGWFFSAACLILTVVLAPLVLNRYMTAHYTYEETGIIYLYGIAVEAIALSGAMFTQVRKIRQEREDALATELTLTQEKLAISNRMAAAAHDIQQPLLSLRMAFAGASSQDNRQNVGSAIEYLDEIARSQIADAKQFMVEPEGPDIEQSKEFEVRIILDNLGIMFADEAK